MVEDKIWYKRGWSTMRVRIKDKVMVSREIGIEQKCTRGGTGDCGKDDEQAVGGGDQGLC